MDWVEILANAANMLGPIAVAGAAWVAAGAAVWGLNTWHREMMSRKRSDLAETTLAMFYEARDLIAAARFPGGYGSEGATRPREENETEAEARDRNALYVPVERLQRHADFWGRLEASQYRFMAVFGVKADEPYQTIREVRNRVIISAGMLIRTHGRRDESRQDLRRQRERWESHIGWGLKEEDELGKQVNEAVSAMERTCRPAIEGRPM